MSEKVISKELRAEIANANDMTFENEEMSKKLDESIVRGIGRLRLWSSKIDLDFESIPDARQLLIDYVRYDLNGMADVFRKNYAEDIAALRLRLGAAAFAEQSTNQNL